MFNTNVTNFRKNIFGILQQTIKYNELVTISTKNGNAVILSEENYNNMMETLYVSSMPAAKENHIYEITGELSYGRKYSYPSGEKPL